MHPAEVEEALESMVVLVDTREQPTPALQQRCKQFGIWDRKKLDAGDYSAKFLHPSGAWYYLPVCIERKYGIDELCNCFCQQRKRFEREFERAARSHIKLYLLVEGASWEQIYSGKYRSHMNPKSLVASILAWLARYDVQILFCRKETSGKLIRDILFREGKERMLKM